MATSDRSKGSGASRSTTQAPPIAREVPAAPVSAVVPFHPREPLPDKPSYLKFAFQNPYNLTLLGGTLAAAALTLNPLLALAGLGLEAIWLVNSDTSILRKLVWDPKFEKMKADAKIEDRMLRVQSLNRADRARVQALIGRQLDIDRLASQNPSFTGDLLRTELTKTERLVDAFIEMAVTSGRYDQYLASVNLSALEADRNRLEFDVKNGRDDDPQVDLARKNLAIILKRQDKMKEIRRYLDVARGQLDLIENSFQLIADQIVTMQSPQELSGQLNELLDGVESIRQTKAETDRILNTLGTT